MSSVKTFCLLSLFALLAIVLEAQGVLARSSAAPESESSFVGNYANATTAGRFFKGAGKFVYDQTQRIARSFVLPGSIDALSNLTRRGVSVGPSASIAEASWSTASHTFSQPLAGVSPPVRRRGTAFMPVDQDPYLANGSRSRFLTQDGNINWSFLLFGTPSSNSPWGFATSRYAVALVIVTVLVNRMQTICRPRGRVLRIKGSKRLLVRLPSLLMLAHSLMTITYLTAALINTTPAKLPSSDYVESMNKLTWSHLFKTSAWKASSIPIGHQDRTREVFWSTFLAVITAQATEVLLATLESRRDEVPAMNLFTFAITLYEERPSVHTAIVIWLTVAELWSLALAGSWKRMSKLTLPITTIFAIAGMIHYAFAANSGSYPFVHGLNRAPDIGLVVIILVTAFLHGLAMLLTEGSIDLRRLVPGRPGFPSMTEEFSIAIFKWGTACLETTAITNGFSRELAAVKMLQKTKAEMEILRIGTHVELSEDGRTKFVEVRRRNAVNPTMPGLGLEVKEVRTASPAMELSSGIVTGARRHLAVGEFVQAVSLRVTVFLGQIWHRMRQHLPQYEVPPWIHAAARRIRLFWHGSNGEVRREQRIAIQSARQQREMQAIMAQLSATRELAAEVAAYSNRPPPTREDVDLDADDWRAILSPDAPLLPDSDENAGSTADYEFVPEDQSDSDNDTESVDDGHEQNQHGIMEDLAIDPDESNTLLDLARMGQSGGGGDFGRIVLAHLAAGDSGPLTRRAFQSTLTGTVQQRARIDRRLEDDTKLLNVIRERRRAPGSESANAHPCAICCSEERTIILWPCRCLNMCDDCRQSISAQAQRGKHRCPTCRSEVKGYSKIWRP